MTVAVRLADDVLDEIVTSQYGLKLYGVFIIYYIEVDIYIPTITT